MPRVPKINGDNYINAEKFKKTGREALRQYNNKCAECGEPATEVHHLDGSRINHDIDNLLPLCDKCHAKMHLPDKLLSAIDKANKKYPEGFYDGYLVVKLNTEQYESLKNMSASVYMEPSEYMKYLIFEQGTKDVLLARRKINEALEILKHVKLARNKTPNL